MSNKKINNSKIKTAASSKNNSTIISTTVNSNKIKIIWIDRKFALNNKKYLEQYFPEKFEVKPFGELNEGIEELKKIKFQYCYVIVSGKYFQDYINAIQEEGKKLNCVPYVFVFCSDKFCKALNEKRIDSDDKFTREETLKFVNNRFFNRGGVYSGIKSMCSRIDNIEKEISLNECDIYRKLDPNDIEEIFQSNKEQNQKLFTFEIKSKESLIFPALYKQMISNQKIDLNSIKNFSNYILNKKYKEITSRGKRVIYVNDVIKPLIDILDEDYFPESILIKIFTFIYTLETDFYKDMNHYLMSQGKQGIYEAFIALMYRGLYLDVFTQNRDIVNKKLYRAQFMNKEEIESIKKLLNTKKDLPTQLLFSNTFLSFTYVEDVYQRFLRKRENLVTVLFIIENAKSLDFTCQADITELSRYKKEGEILFFPFSSFTVEKIEENVNFEKITKDKNGKIIKKETLVITKIYLNFLEKYKNKIDEAIKTVNIDKITLEIKDDDFYKEAMKFNVTNEGNKKIENFESIVKSTFEINQTSCWNEEYVKEIKNNLISNVIVLKSNKLISNNETNFYAYGDKKDKIYSLIVQNKNMNDKSKEKDNKKSYIIQDEFSNSMINYIYEIKDGRIVICCDDNQIKIINKNYVYDKFYFEQRLKNHNSLISNVIELSNGQLCSCSCDGTIKLWNKMKNNLYSEDKNLFLQSKTMFYTIIEISNNNLASLMMNMNDNHKYLFIHINKNNENKMIQIDDLELYNKNLINLGNDNFAFGGINKIYVYNIKGEMINQLDANSNVICLYQLNNQKILISCQNGQLFLTENLISKYTFFSINNPDNKNNRITSITQFKDDTIITRTKLNIFFWAMK